MYEKPDTYSNKEILSMVLYVDDPIFHNCKGCDHLWYIESLSKWSE